MEGPDGQIREKDKNKIVVYCCLSVRCDVGGRTVVKTTVGTDDSDTFAAGRA